MGEPLPVNHHKVRGNHKFLRLLRKDTVVFSSRCIPGNEAYIREELEDLHAFGVKVILHQGESEKLGLSFKPQEMFLHVSGHEQRDGLKAVTEILAPEVIVPFHAPEDRYPIFEDLVGGKKTKRLQIGETLSI